jgi:hypothetical protein
VIYGSTSDTALLPHRRKETYIDFRHSKDWTQIAVGGGLDRKEAMKKIGTVYPPELIVLMKAVLDDATATLPEAKRTSTMKAEIASYILASAAKGQRDPVAMKIAALSAIIDCTHYSHGISPERQAV